ncbi:MAG: alkyl hydroperoxide reductase subunit F, partial [Burkholderiaceae bacterium]|nr:alkyl hydroperoxide reductase subunit F [Burkholderiaceae bacterium]
MLDAAIKNQLQAYLAKVSHDVEITASLDNGEKSQEMRAMLQEIAGLSPRLSYRESNDDNERKPSFALNRAGSQMGVRFAGIPMGHEFTSLVLALLQVGGHPPKAGDEVLEQIRSLDGQYVFETYISLSCQNCPEVVQALNLMSVINPNIRHTMIDGALFQDEV